MKRSVTIADESLLEPSTNHKSSTIDERITIPNHSNNYYLNGHLQMFPQNTDDDDNDDKSDDVDEKLLPIESRIVDDVAGKLLPIERRKYLINARKMTRKGQRRRSIP